MLVYTMFKPALAKPETVVAISSPAVTSAEKTIRIRSPVATGIDRPVVTPLEVVPIATIPVRAGASVTMAPGIGVKTSSGVVDV